MQLREEQDRTGSRIETRPEMDQYQDQDSKRNKLKHTLCLNIEPKAFHVYLCILQHNYMYTHPSYLETKQNSSYHSYKDHISLSSDLQTKAVSTPSYIT